LKERDFALLHITILKTTDGNVFNTAHFADKFQ
jgi:hypothetical protein